MAEGSGRRGATRSGRWVAWTLATGLALPGCRGGEAPPPADETEPVDEVVGVAPAASGGVPAVVMLTLPETVVGHVADTVTVDQLGMVFAPTRLLARPGDAVRFTNSETIAHNVTVRPRGGDAVMNADLDPGAEDVLTITEAGPYDVSCSVHPGMTAFIYVTRAMHAAFAETDGAFTIRDVAPATYRLTVWNPADGALAETTVEVGRGRTRVEVPAGG